MAAMCRRGGVLRRAAGVAILLALLFFSPVASSTASATGIRGRIRNVPLQTPRRSSAVARRAGSVCTEGTFDALAVRWRQTGPGLVRVRVKVGDEAGPWDERHRLHVHPDEGPDAGTREVRRHLRTSDLLWTGAAHCAEANVVPPRGVAISHVRLVLIDGSGEGSAQPSGRRSVGVDRPPIVTRARWGANESLRNCPPSYARRLKAGFVHHTAGSNDYGRWESDDIVRAIYAFHTRVRHWCDIGYNFLVDRYGRVFEGRRGGVWRDVVPAAQQGFNRGAFAAAVMGNFEHARPPRAARRALKRLLAWRLDVAHLPADGRTSMVSTGGPHTRYPTGTEVRLRVINPHRRTGLTACPGDRLARLMRYIRAGAARIGGPKILRPRRTPFAFVPGLEPVLIRARSEHTLDWTVTISRDDRVVKKLGERGTLLRLRWRGNDGVGKPVEPGRYSVRIEGVTGDGRAARPARLRLRAERA